MIHEEIIAAIDEVLKDIPEDEVFKVRFRKLIENALSKTLERSYRDDDLLELLEICMEDHELLSNEGVDQHAG